MGVEYERYLIAKGAAFSPSAAAVATLVEKLRKDKWLPDAPGHAVRTVDNDFGSDVAKKRAASTEAQAKVITAAWLERSLARGAAPRVAGRGRRREVSADDAPAGPGHLRNRAPPLRRVRLPAGRNDRSFADDVRMRRRPRLPVGLRRGVPAFGTSGGIFAECEACSRTFDPGKRAAAITNPFDRYEEAESSAAPHILCSQGGLRQVLRTQRLACHPAGARRSRRGIRARRFFEVGAMY